ncbi:MAG TPA: cyclase family protein [Yinghuangia sp.]|uniref:cyclase family protein n=1 Tax=Yinghuangia sp. YIM S10712 TaxID=3436930 RepID=UPI002CA867D3|nr:cyclase family protein [Yinghuangia sp.]
MTDQTATDTANTTGNWGRWGAEDERGALNLIDPAGVAAAAREVRTGRSYALGLPIQREGVPVFPHRGAPQRLTLSDHTDDMGMGREGGEDVRSYEDVLVLASHSITHMDALCHVQHQGKFYNGFDAATFRTRTGAERCGIEKIGAFTARAVLLDLPRYQGVERLELGYPITSADLAGCAAAQDVEMRSGDVLLVRTGYIDYWLAETRAGREPVYAQAGLTRDSVSFIRDHDIAAVGADNSAIEVMPFDNGVFLTVHIALLVQLGLPLMEHLWLTDLASGMAEAGTHACLLSVSPLPVTGATGSPINPVALV